MKKNGPPSILTPGQYVTPGPGIGPGQQLILGGPVSRGFAHSPPKFKPGQLLRAVGLNDCMCRVKTIKRVKAYVGYRQYECVDVKTGKEFVVAEQNLIYVPQYNNIWNEINAI